MAVLAAGVVKAILNSLAHQRIFLSRFRIHTVLRSSAPHIINEHFSHKGKTFGTGISSLIYDNGGNSPFLPFLPFPLKVCPLAGGPDRHVRIIRNGMPGSVCVLDAVKSGSQKIPGSHVHRLLIGSSAGVGIYLSVVNDLSVLVIGHPQHCRLRGLHILPRRLNQRLQLLFIELEKLGCHSLLCRRPIPTGHLPAFSDRLENSDFLLHIPLLSGISDQLFNLPVDPTEPAPISLLILPLVLLQRFQLFCLPHGPPDPFLLFLRPVAGHVPHHGRDQLFLDSCKRRTNVILIMLHSSAPLSRSPHRYLLIPLPGWRTL